jgi:hypothetical protein
MRSKLATALALNAEVTASAGSPISFVSADSDLNNAASHEGLLVEDPHAHADPGDFNP